MLLTGMAGGKAYKSSPSKGCEGSVQMQHAEAHWLTTNTDQIRPLVHTYSRFNIAKVTALFTCKVVLSQQHTKGVQALAGYRLTCTCRPDNVESSAISLCCYVASITVVPGLKELTRLTERKA